MLQNTTVGATKLSLIKSITESLGSLGHFFVYLLVIFGKLVFNQHIGTITFFRIAVVNQRIIECVHMSGSLPNSRMHKNSRINTYDVLVQQHHTLPPILLDIILQLHSHLTVIVYSAQSVIDITGRKYKTILFTVRY